MNKIFKVIWNHATQSWVATSELSRSKGKTKSLRTAKSALAAAIAVAATSGSAYAAIAIGGGVGGIADTGHGNTATASAASIGTATITDAPRSIAIGDNVTISGLRAGVVIGYDAQAIRAGTALDTTDRTSTVIGSRAIVRNVSTGGTIGGRGTTAIGGNSVAALLTDAGAAAGDAPSLTSADYATESGDVPTRNAVGVLYRAGITDAAGTLIPGTVLQSNEATAIGYDSRAIGDQSISIGAQTIAGHASVAIGGNDTGRVTNAARGVYAAQTGQTLATDWDTTYAKDGSTAIGIKSFSNSSLGTAIGLQAQVHSNSTLGTAIGSGSRVGKSDGTTPSISGVAIGAGSVAESNFTTAVGTGSQSLALNATSLGYKAKANGTNATAVGAAAIAAAADALAYGANATAYAANAVAIGTNATVTSTGESSIAFGTDTNVSGVKSVALGSNIAKLTTDGSVVLGDSSTEVTGAGAGAPHGVGTVPNAEVTSSNGAVITYGGFAGQPADAGKYVSIGAVGAERQLKNVAAGNVAPTSTDAINGSQLYSIAAELGNQVFKSTYFHVNNASATQGAGDSATNLGGITDKAGAIGDYAVTAGVNATSPSIAGVAIGHGAKVEKSSSATGSGIAIGTGTLARDGSVVIGERATIIGDTGPNGAPGAIAIGKGATVEQDQGGHSTAIAIGNNAYAMARQTPLRATDHEGNEVIVGVGTSIGDSAYSNSNSVALGQVANASGQNATAIGSASTASGEWSTAVGTNSTATNNYTTAMGYNATATAERGIAIGYNALADGANAQGAVAVGTNTVANATFTTAVGYQAKATGNYSTALGYLTETSNFSTAVGAGSKAKFDNSTALGYSSQAKADFSTALGRSTHAAAENATAVGARANASLAGSVALGNASTTLREATQENTATVGSFTYSGFAGNKPNAGYVVSVGSAGNERQIHNVAAGNVSATSTDAINGSQLYLVAVQAAKPLTIKANTNNDTDAKLLDTQYAEKDGTQLQLGNTLNIIGAATAAANIARDTATPTEGTYSAKNVQTVVSNNEVQIQIAEKPEFKEIKVKADDNDTNPVVISSGAGNTGGKITNIEGNLPGAKTGDTAPTTEQAAPTNIDDIKNNAATVGDVLNAGWNLQENGVAKDLVTPYNTVNFINGTGTAVNITTTNNVSVVTVDIDLADPGLTTTVGDTKLEDGTAGTNGKIDAPTTGGDKLVNATTVVDAINASGFTLKSSATAEGTKDAASTGDEIIKPGSTVEMVAGKNMTVKQEANGKITYATEENVDFDTVTISNGTTVPSVKLVNEAPIAANNNPDAPTSSLNITNTDGKPTQLTGVGSVLNTVATPNSTGTQGSDPNKTPETVGNVNLVDLGTGTSTTTLPDNVLNSAATVRDLANMGWVVSTPNNNFTQAVKNANQVNFIGTGGVDVQGALNATTGIYDVTLKLSPAGTLVLDDINSATPVPGTTNPSGTVEVKDNPAGFVGAENIAKMINGAGWNLLNNDEHKDLVNPGNKVNFVDGLGTLVTIASDGTESIVQVDVDFGNMSNNANGTINGPVSAEDAAKLRQDVTDAQEALRLADEALAADPTNQTLIDAVTAAEQALLDADNAANDAGLYQVATAQNVSEMINKSGWNVTSGAVGSGVVSGTTDELINPGEQVTFRAGDNMVLTQTGNVFTYSVSKDPAFNSTTVGGTPTTTYTDLAGNPLTKVGDTFVDANGDKVDPSQVNATTTYANPISIGTVDGKNVISNLASTLPNATSVGATPPTTTAPNKADGTPFTAQDAQDLVNAAGNNAATLGDVLNAGWNLQGNGKEVDFVKPYDTVNFVNGQGTTAVLGSDGNVSTVTYNVNVDNKTTEITYADAKGNLLTPVKDAAGNITGYTNADGSPYTGPVTSQISAIGPKVNGENVTGPISLVNGDTTTVTNTPNGIKVEVNTGEITPETDGSVTGPVTPALTDALKAAQDALAALPDTATEAEKKAAQDAVDAAQTAINNAGSQVATAQNVADAINASGWRTNSTTATGTATETLVNPGEQVNFEAGKNMAVTQKVEKDANGADVISYTYATTENVTFSNAVVNQILSLGDVTKPGAPVVNMTAVNASTPVGVENGDITPAINMSNATFTGLAPNLPTTVSTGNASTSTTSQAAPTVTPNQTTNAATLGDVLNAGWNLQENGKAKDFVKPYDTVNFVNGTGTTANITTDGNVSSVTYNVNVDNQTTEITYTNKAGDPIYKLADGTYNTSADGKGTRVAEGDISSQVSAKTSPLTNNADGTVNTPANPKALATAGDVANAINNSGFTLTTSASAGEVSGTSKELVKPGKTVTIDAGKNISVTQNAGTITVATKKDVEFDSVKAGPVTINSSGINAGGTKITNVAPGKDGTDAVNVNQLKQVAGDIHNKVNRNNKDLRAGIAGANAAAGLPQVYIPGKSMVAASAGTFKGQSALAVGYSRASDNGKLILKLQGNANTRGDVGGSVGVGYQW